MSASGTRFASLQPDHEPSHGSTARELDSVEPSEVSPRDGGTAGDRARETERGRAQDEDRASPGGIDQDDAPLGDEASALREREPTSTSSARGAGAPPPPPPRFSRTMAAVAASIQEEAKGGGTYSRPRFVLGERKLESGTCGGLPAPSAPNSAAMVEPSSAATTEAEAGAVDPAEANSDAGAEEPQLRHHGQPDQANAEPNRPSLRHARWPTTVLVGALLLGMIVGGGAVGGLSLSGAIHRVGWWEPGDTTSSDHKPPPPASPNQHATMAASAPKWPTERAAAVIEPLLLLTANHFGKSQAQPFRGAATGGRSGPGEVTPGDAAPRGAPVSERPITAAAVPYGGSMEMGSKASLSDAEPSVIDAGMEADRDVGHEERADPGEFEPSPELDSPSIGNSAALSSAMEQTDQGATAATDRPMSPKAGEYRIQLASFREREVAEATEERIASELQAFVDFTESHIEEATTTDGMYYRVQIGAFVTHVNANSSCEKLKRNGIDCFVIRRAYGG